MTILPIIRARPLELSRTEFELVVEALAVLAGIAEKRQIVSPRYALVCSRARELEARLRELLRDS